MQYSEIANEFDIRDGWQFEAVWRCLLVAAFPDESATWIAWIAGTQLTAMSQ